LRETCRKAADCSIELITSRRRKISPIRSKCGARIADAAAIAEACTRGCVFEK